MSLKATVLNLEDEDYNLLLHRVIYQIDEDYDPDVPDSELGTSKALFYLPLVTDILNDPFKVDNFLSANFTKREQRWRRAVIFDVIEEWLNIIGTKYSISSLLDVRVVNEKLFLLGESNAKQNISFNGVGKWNSRYVQRNKDKRFT